MSKNTSFNMEKIEYKYNISFGYRHRINFNVDYQYNDIMNQINKIAARYDRGMILFRSNHAADLYDELTVDNIPYHFDPVRMMSNGVHIKNALIDVLDSPGKDTFIISYCRKVLFKGHRCWADCQNHGGAK